MGQGQKLHVRFVVHQGRMSDWQREGADFSGEPVQGVLGVKGGGLQGGVIRGQEAGWGGGGLSEDACQCGEAGRCGEGGVGRLELAVKPGRCAGGWGREGVEERRLRGGQRAGANLGGAGERVQGVLGVEG